MADAGIRLTVEGEKEFRAALAECDTAVKNNQKSLKLLTEEFKLNEAGMKDAQSGFGSMADAAEILASKGKVLADSIEVQTEKVGLLDARVEEASRTYGEHDKRTEALRAQLLDASTALTKLTAEQEKNRQAMLDAENSTKEYDDAVKALEAQLAANEAELKAMGGGMQALEKEYGALGQSSEDLEKKSENLRAQNENLTAQNEKLADSVSKQRDLVDNLAAAQETAARRYGEGSTQAEAYRKKLAEATGQLDEMERELGENEEAIRANNQALEDGGESPNGMISGLDKIEQLTGIKIPAGIKEMIGGFDGGTVAVGGIVTALTAVGKKLFDLYTETIDWANDVTTKSAELDLSTTEYQQLEYVANKAGIEVSVLESALTKVSQKAGDAEAAQIKLTQQIAEQKEEVQRAWEAWDAISASETEQYAAAQKAYEDANKALSDLEEQLADATSYWDNLGISIEDENGKAKSALDLLLELIDAYKDMPEGIERTAEMTDIFGKSYKTLNPLVSEGSKTIREWMEEGVKMKAVMDEDTVATANLAAAQKNVFDQIMDRAKKQAIADFAESGFSIAEGFKAGRDYVIAFNDAVKQIYDLEPLKVIFGWSSDKKWYENLLGFDSSNIGMLINGIKGLTNKSGGKYAYGTNYAPGGYALVGERGPEIVDLPRGSKVYPNGVLPAGFGGGTTVNESNVYNITIDAASVEEFNDIVRIAQGARVGMRRG